MYITLVDVAPLLYYFMSRQQSYQYGTVRVYTT
jgi:hypothetical protein